MNAHTVEQCSKMKKRKLQNLLRKGDHRAVLQDLPDQVNPAGPQRRAADLQRKAADPPGQANPADLQRKAAGLLDQANPADLQRRAVDLQSVPGPLGQANPVGLQRKAVDLLVQTNPVGLQRKAVDLLVQANLEDLQSVPALQRVDLAADRPDQNVALVETHG
jgi:hypothetical protein